jgi:nucleotide-binding universal stress UspA family protein
MSTTTRPLRDAEPAADFQKPNDAPILVASDGTDFSRPALEAALELTASRHAPVRIVAVVRDLPVMPLDFGIVVAPPEDSAAVRDALLFRVKAQLVAVAGADAEWPIEVRWGDAAQEIANAARDAGARVIVLGVEHRSMADKLFARETALALLRLSRVPLFIVPRGFSTAPTRMAVSTDFSHASIAAARLALELFPAIRQVDLVHVRPMRRIEAVVEHWLAPIEEAIDGGFEHARLELAAPRSVRVECVTIKGDAAREVVAYARDSGAELLVMGSSGAGLIERMLVGSTSRKVVRDAPCAALAVHPDSERDGPFALLDRHRERIPRHQWSDRLEAFSRRNMGRKTTVEVISKDLGSQLQDRDVRFLGATWDPFDQRVEIMVGGKDEGSHHTRNIAGVEFIDQLQDASGRDWILRVTDGQTQTFLTLSRSN